MLIKAFLTAAGLSFFIYAKAFGAENVYINSVVTLLALYSLIGSDPKEAFWTGFFTGLLWFYWIGLSFRYYEVGWMIPLVSLGVAAIYGTIFGALFKSIDIVAAKRALLKSFLQALSPIALSAIKPFGFNWMMLQISLCETVFSCDDIAFLLILLALWAVRVSSKLIIFTIVALFAALAPEYEKPPMPDIRIKLLQTHIPQNIKWDPRYKNEIVRKNIEAIKLAAEHGYEMVVLPESAFPLYLNEREDLIDTLKELSKKIVIVTGALHYKEGAPYNSAYVFQNENMIIADKTVLVPFGEKTPLPEPLKSYVNELFFGGAADYEAARAPTRFSVNEIPFQIAICYEATHPKIYENRPKYIIAISNNAWFTPSIEPTLQNILIKYFARKNKSIVFHSTNIAKTGIIW